MLSRPSGSPDRRVIRLSSSTTLLPLFPLQTRVPHVSSPEKVETHRRMRELRLSIPSLFGAPSPGRDPTENLVRTITCICDSYVATRGSVFGPTTLVTEPLSPLTPQVQTDLINGVCRAPAELLTSFESQCPSSRPTARRGDGDRWMGSKERAGRGVRALRGTYPRRIGDSPRRSF